MPVHKIQPTKTVVPFTWCGVDPARKGVQSSWPQHPVEVTCKACLAEEARAKAPKVHTAVKAPPAPKRSPLAAMIDTLIEHHGIDEVLEEVKGYAYGRMQGHGCPWEDIFEALAVAADKIKEVKT